MSINKRVEDRLVPLEVVVVRDESSNAEVGRVLDYSVNGFMLSTHLKLKNEEEYRYSFSLKNGDSFEKLLTFRTQCRWKRLDPSTGLMIAGFKILHRGEDKIALIKALIHRNSK
tara:strand:+ start:8516 stop:8857 length:342 start_codon:yes stop_codon:yes gene_type:complete